MNESDRNFMNYFIPLALGFVLCSLFIGLRYHQAYRRRIELQRKRRLQSQPQAALADYANHDS
jgi:hypothetical protein